ncbi:hypothetical protein [Marinobacter sp.]|uniref:hypothetical protein n=1 Tax=Marinobacter sp. TaxID=50741 RepID=UPI00384BF735
MIYRVVTLVGAILLVVLLFCLLWLFCRRFLERQGVAGNLSDRAMVLATWTFAGISIGLLFVVVGAFVAGPWAFYRTLRSWGDVPVSDAGAIWWGLGIVVLALGITALAAAALLVSVGAV